MRHDRDADEILNSLGQENISANTPVFKLSTSQQQMIEICKAISTNSRIVVFDEPTAVLTQKETELLFQIIARLKEQESALYTSLTD